MPTKLGVTMSTQSDSPKSSPWPQPKRNRKGDERRERKKQRVQNWYDNVLARKDRLEDQRRRQLSSIQDSIGDIANKEWDVLTEACRDKDDADEEDSDGFDIEEDVSEEWEEAPKRSAN
jgi:hypothetical protein